MQAKHDGAIAELQGKLTAAERASGEPKVAPFEKAKMQNATMLRLAQPRGARSAPQLVVTDIKTALDQHTHEGSLTTDASPIQAPPPPSLSCHPTY